MAGNKGVEIKENIPQVFVKDLDGNVSILWSEDIARLENEGIHIKGFVCKVGASFSGVDISTGKGLHSLVDKAKKLGKKDIVDKMVALAIHSNILDGESACLISGIKGSGKTTAIIHTIKELLDSGYSEDRILYIKVVGEGVRLKELHDFVESLAEEVGDKLIVFIDGATKIYKFLEEIKWIVSSAFDNRVFLSGSDNYVFELAMEGVLLGKGVLLKMNTISLKEYLRISSKELEGLNKKEIIKRYMMSYSIKECGEKIDLLEFITEVVVNNLENTVINNDSASEFFTMDSINKCKKLVEKFNRSELGYPVMAVLLNMCKIQGYKGLEDISELSKRIALGINEIKVINSIVRSTGLVHGVYNLCNLWDIEGDRILAKCKYYIPIGGIYFTLLEDMKMYINNKMGDREIHGKVLEALVIESLRAVRSERFDIDSIGYIKFADREGSNIEVDIVVAVDYKNKEGSLNKKQRKVLIEVEYSKKAKKKYARDMEHSEVKERLNDVKRRYVVYMGKTKKVKGVKYINAFDFLIDTEKFM